MERSPSIRSCSRARTTERGFALALALIVAVLYFGLIQLMLFDASRGLAEARRFRARIVALTLAENGAELAATQIVIVSSNYPVAQTDWQGSYKGTMEKHVAQDGSFTFTISATGDATGVVEQHATVEVKGGGHNGKSFYIASTNHSQ